MLERSTSEGGWRCRHRRSIRNGRTLEPDVVFPGLKERSLWESVNFAPQIGADPAPSRLKCLDVEFVAVGAEKSNTHALQYILPFPGWKRILYWSLTGWGVQMN